MSMSDEDKAKRIFRLATLAGDKIQLLEKGSRWHKVTKQQTESLSNQYEDSGEIEQPFDLSAAAQMTTRDIYHSTCIETKVASCIGLGHVGADKNASGKSKVAEALDPLTLTTWQDTLTQVAQDYFGVANGYLEIVRDGVEDDGEILGIYHVPAPEVTIHVSRGKNGKVWTKHYLVDGQGYVGRRFAQFGAKRAFMEVEGTGARPDEVSEIIHIPRVSNLHRWYGVPDWLAAIPLMELTSMLYQYLFDFFQNRGVPEFMLFLTGGTVSDEDWKVIQDALRAQIGVGNSRKSIALQIPEEVKINLEKLALENPSDGQMFKDVTESSAMSIVSAHRVPPLLAGILVPGKLGATNELPNALKGFQALVMGPAQHTIQSALGCTLGEATKNGSLKLTQKDFAFRKITDEIDTAEADTISRMRTPLAQAQAEGRDPADGLKS